MIKRIFLVTMLVLLLSACDTEQERATEKVEQELPQATFIDQTIQLPAIEHVAPVQLPVTMETTITTATTTTVTTTTEITTTTAETTVTSSEPEPKYTDEELEILAIIIYQEAGADYCSDETRMMVGNVFLNRVASEHFPDSFLEVATQKRQYGRLYWTGLKWPEQASQNVEAHAVERAYTIARRLLDGERVLPEDVIFQSEYIMGEIVAHSDGFYFCK